MKKNKPEMKMFLVRKYVMAKSAIHAIKISKNQPPDEVWIDEDWKKNQANNLASAIGFHTDD